MMTTQEAEVTTLSTTLPLKEVDCETCQVNLDWWGDGLVQVSACTCGAAVWDHNEDTVDEFLDVLDMFRRKVRRRWKVLHDLREDELTENGSIIAIGDEMSS
jgi:hypothetical protein